MQFRYKTKRIVWYTEFKTVQEVSTQRKKLEVYESETYRQTLLLTKGVLQERNCKFLVKDAVCHFWVPY